MIVDEAHHLRDRASQSYKLVDGLTKRFLLLLSATPVQNNLIELYNLLTLLKPGIFKTQKEFRAAYMTAGKPRQPANPERLRDLMRDAMIRNTRAVVALKLPRRHASTRCVDPAAAEQAAYQELAALIRALVCGRPGRAPPAGGAPLLSAAGSSPAAATAAIARFAARHGGDPAWRGLAQRWAALGAGAKEMALLELLARNPEEKKLVFIHHRETMASLADLLARNGVAFARFEGGLSGPDKDAAIADFRERVPVLLCTESGGEGRNIQFCNTLINFDIPWNPMAIEQRIGRIDRIGQTREVFVFNLVARGTVEEQVLRLLDEKINMFELVVGEAGAILGELDEERDFADLVLDAWLETTAAARAEAFDALGRRLDEARSAIQRRQGARRCAVRRRIRDRLRQGDRAMTALRDFVADLMEREGAAVEPLEPDGLAVIAPPEIRAAFGWPELARLGFGAELPPARPARSASKATGWSASARCSPIAGGAPSARSCSTSRRPLGDPERLLGHALDLPNAVWRFQGQRSTWTRCLLIAFRTTASSDEKRENICGWASTPAPAPRWARCCRGCGRLYADLAWQRARSRRRGGGGAGLGRRDAGGAGSRRRSTRACGPNWRRFFARCSAAWRATMPACTAIMTICAGNPCKRLAALEGIEGAKADADRQREQQRIAAIEREYRAISSATSGTNTPCASVSIGFKPWSCSSRCSGSRF